METLANSHLPKVPRNKNLSSRILEAWPRILAATAVAIVVSLSKYAAHWVVPTISPVPFTIMGVAISIMLGFRNTTAYNRFWEARTLWGAHINASRSFARQVMTLIVGEDENAIRPFQEDIVMATIAYAHSFKNHLQDDDPLDGIEKLMLPDEAAWLRTQKNVPVAILHIIGRRLAWGRAQGWIAGSATIILEGTLTDVTNVQGACERIKNTPIPKTYVLLSRTLVTFFALFLTFGILEEAAWITPIVVFLVAYALIGFDSLAGEVAEPFGHDPHDLPLEKYTETIETNLRQILSDRDLPTLHAGIERPVIVDEGKLFD